MSNVCLHQAERLLEPQANAVVLRILQAFLTEFTFNKEKYEQCALYYVAWDFSKCSKNEINNDYTFGA